MATQQWYIQTLVGMGDELAAYLAADNQPLHSFGPIARINILVGATNSGKSRFLRGLARSSSYGLFNERNAIDQLSSALDACEAVSKLQFSSSVAVMSAHYDTPRTSGWRVKDPGAAVRDRVTFVWEPNRFLEIKEQLQAVLQPADLDAQQAARQPVMDSMARLTPLMRTISSGRAPKSCHFELIELIYGYLESLTSSEPPTVVHPPKVYIPVLRSAVFLRGCRLTPHADVFAETLRQNHDLGKHDIDLFTGNKLYTLIRSARDDFREIRSRLRAFERFLSDAFFAGAPVEIVPLHEGHAQGEHLVLSVGQTERLFHNIGDGLQAVVVLMYRLFMAEPGTWVFIEEPEQGLHPGLQRIFLETISSNEVLQEKHLTLFMSTHSNHLLGMAMSEFDNVSVFSLQKSLSSSEDRELFQIRPVLNRELNALALLGVANSSVFLANCSIWVEGVTDRKYLRAFLRAYQESDEFAAHQGRVYQEDIHFAFFEYAGSNIAHYFFSPGESEPADIDAKIRALALSNRIFLLADRDEAKEEKHAHLSELQQDNCNFQYCVTPGIEVENLISEFEMSRVLPDLAKELTEDDVRSAGICQSEYRDRHIGKYLIETFRDKHLDAVVAPSGTLKTYYKNRLCELICSLVVWDNMSDDAKCLTKTLYEFIQRHNEH
ncbi:MAG: AAA family ATPase [Anaerolineae bacterium]|nr:AAA family ATPase [Anaerolineae bacterium]